MDAALIATIHDSAGHDPTSRGRWRMSLVPSWWSITPTDMNSVALNTAWARTSTQPAVADSAVPMPNSTNMKPSWLIVPKASSSLRSCWRRARNPPNSIDTAPIVTTAGRQNPTPTKAGAKRATR